MQKPEEHLGLLSEAIHARFLMRINGKGCCRNKAFGTTLPWSVERPLQAVNISDNHPSAMVHHFRPK